MSYNGIGLSTARGSGTNGYVQRNLSHLPKWKERVGFNGENRLIPLKAEQEKQAQQREEALRAAEEARRERGPNVELLIHERKRMVEIRCLELRDKLEDEGKLTEEEIDDAVNVLREQLMSKLEEIEMGPAKEFEIHRLQAEKKKANERFENALKIEKSYKEGKAFDPEWQEEQKQARIKAREEAYEKRMEEKRKREKASRKDSRSRSPRKTSKSSQSSSSRRSRSDSRSSDRSSSSDRDGRSRRRRHSTSSSSSSSRGRSRSRRSSSRSSTESSSARSYRSSTREARSKTPSPRSRR